MWKHELGSSDPDYCKITRFSKEHNKIRMDYCFIMWTCKNWPSNTLHHGINKCDRK